MRELPGNDFILGQLSGGSHVLGFPRTERDKHLYVWGHRDRQVEISRAFDPAGHQAVAQEQMRDARFRSRGSLYDSLIEWLAWNERILAVPIVPIDLRQDDWIVSYNLLRQRETADPAVLADTAPENLVQRACV